MDIGQLFSVKNKVVLVTGGGRGVGLYMAQGFVTNGATVYITSRNYESCKKVAKELTDKGPGKCHALPSVDLSTADACDLLGKELAKVESKLHVLVNNSGASWGEPMEKYQEIGWDKVMNLNVKAIFYVTRACLPLLKAAATANDPARVINVGSVAGLRIQLAPTYAYDTSKAAVHHLTRKLACELGPQHITVNAIAPGFVPSKMSNQLLTYAPKEFYAEKTLLGRIGTAEDMAAVAIYLSSHAGTWVTGTVIPVDGGSILYSNI